MSELNKCRVPGCSQTRKSRSELYIHLFQQHHKLLDLVPELLFTGTRKHSSGVHCNNKYICPMNCRTKTKYHKTLEKLEAHLKKDHGTRAAIKFPIICDNNDLPYYCPDNACKKKSWSYKGILNHCETSHKDYCESIPELQKLISNADNDSETELDTNEDMEDVESRDIAEDADTDSIEVPTAKTNVDTITIKAFDHGGIRKTAYTGPVNDAIMTIGSMTDSNMVFVIEKDGKLIKHGNFATILEYLVQL
jgi:hypothetical protein